MSIVTSKLATVVAVNIARRAGFLKVGSKDYFSDQINGSMKAGQTYSFVIPDAGSVVSGLTASPREIDERQVDLTIQNFVNSVETGAIEGVTDLKWESEVADQYAQKLINAVLNAEVPKALRSATTSFIGSGFLPIANAGAHIQSITTDEVYGFIDPMAQAVLASNGQQFVPTGAPGDLYSKGKLGIFQGVEYAAERFIKPVIVSSDLASLESSITSASINDEGYLEIQLADAVSIPVGAVFYVSTLYACDTIGDPTSVLYSFINSVASDSGLVTCIAPEFEDVGGRSIALADGTSTDLDSLVGLSIYTDLEEGSYRRAVIRANGAYCFSSVDKLDFKWSESYAEGDVDGVRVLVNQFSDGLNAKNLTRWDFPYLAGVVEPRACSVAYFKNV